MREARRPAFSLLPSRISVPFVVLTVDPTIRYGNAKYMKGFEGPFEFDVDEIAEAVTPENIPEDILQEIMKGGCRRKDGKIYRFKICAVSTDIQKQRHHDWSKVKKVFIEARPLYKRSAILGISPTSRSVRENPGQMEMGILSLIHGASIVLFRVLEFKLELGDLAKWTARGDRKSVISTSSKRIAQWIFTDGWDDLEFEMHIFVFVPDGIADELRYISLSVTPTIRKCRRLNNVKIWDHRVYCP